MSESLPPPADPQLFSPSGKRDLEGTVAFNFLPSDTHTHTQAAQLHNARTETSDWCGGRRGAEHPLPMNGHNRRGDSVCAPCGGVTAAIKCRDISFTFRMKVFPQREVCQWPWNVGSMDFITWRRNVCVVKYCKHCKGLLPQMMGPKSNISWRENCAPRATFSFRDNKNVRQSPMFRY